LRQMQGTPFIIYARNRFLVDNMIMELIQYLVLLLAEIIAFSIFVYFVSTRTHGQISRRWKASAFVSVLYGLLSHDLGNLLLLIGWNYGESLETLLIDLPNKLTKGFLFMINLAAFYTMPAIIIGVFFAYLNFWSSGDLWIEKYWKNPKISYRDHEPPILKF
jgi:hypothetical protein